MTCHKDSWIDRHPVRFYTLLAAALIAFVGGCFFAGGGNASNAVYIPTSEDLESQRARRRAESAAEQLLELHDRERRENAPYVRTTP